MGLDPLSPVAPARVRCLLLPCGRITRTRFLEFTRRLQNEAIVRLGDVSPTSQPEKNTFSPLAFPQGVIVFDLVVSESSPGQRALYPFEVSREPLVVLGLADSAEYGFSTRESSNHDGTPATLDGEAKKQILSELKETSDGLKAVYTVALVHKILLFDLEGTLSSAYSSIIPVPPPSKTTIAAMKTLMCDVASELVVEMATYAKTIQSLYTIETPKQIMPDGYVAPPPEPDGDSKRQSWFPGGRSSSPGQAFQRFSQRASLPAHLFTSAAPSPTEEHPRSETTSPTGDNTATTFEQMHISKGDRRATNLEAPSHDRASIQGFGSDPASDRARTQGRGRVGIVMGQMYLVAGRWPDAVRELVHGGIMARSTNDHVWHAKAVDTILVTLLMCAWAGVDFDVPPLCLPIAEKSSVLLGKSSKKNEPINMNETFVSQNATKEAKVENLKSLTGMLPEIIHHIIRLYTRSTAEPVAQMALSETFIRLSKLSAILLFCPGLADNGALDAIVLNHQIKPSPNYTPFISLSSPAKAEIASIALASMPPQGLRDMISYTDRLAIHAGTATVLGMLGYHRKKAFVLRELLSFLLPALEQGSEEASVGFGMYSSPFLGSPDVSNGLPKTAEKVNPDAQNTETVYDFLALICQTYGAVTVSAIDDLDQKRVSRYRTGSTNGTDSRSDEGALVAAQIETEALTRSFGSKRLKVDLLFTCMNICEIIPDLRGTIAFASSILRTVGSGIAPGPQDIDGGPSLGPDDQIRVSGAITHAASTAANIGLGKVEAEYWDDFMLRDVEILPISPDLSLTPRKRSDLAAVKAIIATQPQGPFIVNQFTSRISASKRETVIAAGERFSFAILLQNLYDVNLEVEHLEIVASGVSLDAKIERVLIGPYKTQRLRLIATALSSGQLSVTGCLIKIKDCNARWYPIFRDVWRPAERLKLKQQGISSILGAPERPSSTASGQIKSLSGGKPTTSTLSAKIIDAQPRVILKSTSIPQENVMVLEGERRTISVTVQNVSEKKVDFVSLSFDDSTLPILQAAVQDRELPAADLYEVEYGIYKKAALSWTRPNENSVIEPGKELTLDIEVLGKPGLTTGTVLLDYAGIGEGAGESDYFYTRRLSVQFAITVSPSIDLVRNDILALTGPLAYHDHLAKDQTPEGQSEAPTHTSGEWTERLMQPIRERLAMPSEDQEYCLLLLDFYNSYSSTLSVSPEIKKTTGDNKTSDDGWTSVFSLVENVDPGQSTRFLVPVPRVSLSDPYAPIPSLNPASKRQFVVSTGKISEGYERSSRDAFWHREELLRLVRVKWRDPAASGRTGLVELRAIRLTTRMLDALKVESLSVTIELTGGDHVRRIGPAHFKTVADEFVAVRTRLRNRSRQPIHAILRLQPCLRNVPYNVALDLTRKFAFTGLLQQPLDPIPPGHAVDVHLGCVFLCAAEFEVGASVEEMRIPTAADATQSEPPSSEEEEGEGEGGENKAARRKRAPSQVDLDVLSTERTNRRIWFAKDACMVDVEEAEEDEDDDDEDDGDDDNDG